MKKLSSGLLIDIGDDARLYLLGEDIAWKYQLRIEEMKKKRGIFSSFRRKPTKPKYCVFVPNKEDRCLARGFESRKQALEFIFARIIPNFEIVERLAFSRSWGLGRQAQSKMLPWCRLSEDLPQNEVS